MTNQERKELEIQNLIKFIRNANQSVEDGLAQEPSFSIYAFTEDERKKIRFFGSESPKTIVGFASIWCNTKIPYTMESYHVEAEEIESIIKANSKIEIKGE